MARSHRTPLALASCVAALHTTLAHAPGARTSTVIGGPGEKVLH